MPAPKRENLLVNLACNILIPSLVLSKLSTDDRLGPVYGLVVALAFPLGYGVWDFLNRREANFISIIGFLSVLLTGGLGLAKAGGIWFAVKEASVPVVIGLAVWLSTATKRPLVKTFIYNPQVIDVARVDAALDARGTRAGFDLLLVKASRLLVLSFLVSAALNFALARWFLVSEPGTPAFNAELGKMNFWSWPVIVVPSMAMMMAALWTLLNGLKTLTGLPLDDLFHPDATKKK